MKASVRVCVLGIEGIGKGGGLGETKLLLKIQGLFARYLVT